MFFKKFIFTDKNIQGVLSLYVESDGTMKLAIGMYKGFASFVGTPLKVLDFIDLNPNWGCVRSQVTAFIVKQKIKSDAARPFLIKFLKKKLKFNHDEIVILLDELTKLV